MDENENNPLSKKLILKEYATKCGEFIKESYYKFKDIASK